MKQKRVLDSFALLAYLNREAAVEKIRKLLAEAQRARQAEEAVQTGASLLMNEINVGETYYILSRTRGAEKPTIFLKQYFPGFPLRWLRTALKILLPPPASRQRIPFPLLTVLPSLPHSIIRLPL